MTRQAHPRFTDQPRPEVAGHLARPIFQGWRATSGRAMCNILPDKSVKRGCVMTRQDVL